MLNNLFKKNKSSRLIDSVRIAEPCNVPFSSMSGDERIRHCAACKKNVYNISAMSEGEAESLLRSSNDGLCLNIYRRTDGTIIFDNCPVGLRKARARMTKVAVILLLAVGLSCLAQKIEAQGLVGAPVDPGRWGGPGPAYDPGPDPNILATGSILSFGLALLTGIFRVKGTQIDALLQFGQDTSSVKLKMLMRRRIIEAVIITIAAPILFYLGCVAMHSYLK